MNHSVPLSLRRAKAFTVIELISVIAVLLVLALLSLSALNGMQAHNRNVKCLHHLKQVGVALFAYAADHQQMLPPRNLGHLREEAKDRPPMEDRPWVNRLIRFGYVENPDIFYCPSFAPYNNARSSNPLPTNGSGPLRTYGIRTWVPPGYFGFGKKLPQEEHKPLAAISEPADFFIVADSIWLDSPYSGSQGYGINPGMQESQLIHLRHRNMANALFADGHVEAKPGSYFEALSRADRQRAYSGGKDLPFGVTNEMNF